MKVGSITTDIIKNGLVFNMDAANRASTIPVSTIETSFNTVNTNISGAFSDNGIFDSSTISPSFAFGGTDDYIDLNMDLSPYNEISVGIWCYFSNNSGFMYSFGAGSSSGAGTGLGIARYTGVYEIYTWDGANINRTSTNVTQNVWSYIVVTQIGTIRKVYIDGILVSTFPSAGNLNLNSTTEIGRWTADDYYLNGNTSPIHIYNRALSSTEVLHNYNALKGRFS